MQHCDYFDYWGRGTEVTVSSEATSSPTLFPLFSCDSGSGDKITLGCLAHDFFPKSATFQWSDASGTSVPSEQYISALSNSNNKFTGVSVISVTKSKSLSYNCSVTHPGGTKQLQVKKEISTPKVTLISGPSGDKQTLTCYIEQFAPKQVSVTWEKNGNVENGDTIFSPTKVGNLYSAVSVLRIPEADWNSKNVYTCKVTHQGETHKSSIAPLTMDLNPPTNKEIFNNRRAELKCSITKLSETNIIWQIDGKDVTENVRLETSTNRITSILTRSLNDWQSVKNVRCSAVRNDVILVTQELPVNRKGANPRVTVLTPTAEEKDSAEVRLACLVFSDVEQDYYIAWSVDEKQNSGNYEDSTFTRQKTRNGYLVTSVYTTTKNEWDKEKVFNCNVWPAGSDAAMEAKGVSKASGFPSELICMFESNCTYDAAEEDDFSSLWSTASTFILLFIFSLLYNMIFSLVQMKKQ